MECVTINKKKYCETHAQAGFIHCPGRAFEPGVVSEACGDSQGGTQQLLIVHLIQKEGMKGK